MVGIDGTYRAGKCKGEVGVRDTKRVGATARCFDGRTTGKGERGTSSAEWKLRIKSNVQGTVRPESRGLRNQRAGGDEQVNGSVSV